MNHEYEIIQLYGRIAQLERDFGSLEYKFEELKRKSKNNYQKWYCRARNKLAKIRAIILSK